MNILIFSAGNPGSIKKAPDKRERWLKTPGAFFNSTILWREDCLNAMF